ncbi:MAG: RnfABCDGE type electron transport complex subunit G [Clostridia bacterium]|nr:RnfABCDGE type electron transport complex subunit G [Clostridia bacterium]
MKLNAKTVLVPALILVCICIVVSALLGVTNNLTKDKIAEVQAKNAEMARGVVLPDAEAFEEVTAEENVYYVGKAGDSVVGYVFTTAGKGYGGDVEVMTGISTDGNITGISILTQNETPGLGGNCTKESFQEQYKQGAQTIAVVKNQEAGEGQIQALTGATITSRAVTDAVNEAVDMYNSVKEG